ncbi:MAG: hypothetical protein CMJ49_04480 [Planctomycetaceae bacterium]|nr:hypothetical protein [Planctomycetaceae bacterium]
MKVSHESYEDVTVVAVKGEITLDEISPLKQLLDEQLARDARDFVLDLTEVPFIDSAGLESMLWLQDQAGEKLGQVRIVGPDENVRKILEITRLQHDFDAHEDIDSAIKSLR